MNPRTQYRQCMPVYVHVETLLRSSIIEIRKHSLMSRFINAQSSIMHYKIIQQLINAYLGDQLPSMWFYVADYSIVKLLLIIKNYKIYGKSI